MRRILTASDRALLVEEEDLPATVRLLRALEAAALQGVEELVPAARTVLVRFDPHAARAAELREAIAALNPEEAKAGRAREHLIPVRYDGEDLEEVASLLGIAPDELARRHQAATWTVAFTGFAPGFGYLVGDDPIFDVPRRPSPRTRIPRGAVALAGRYSGVYPRESPGGWQLIGQTDVAMWDLGRERPALLAPGDVVRFTDAGPGPASASPTPETMGVLPAGDDARALRPALEVVTAGAQLLLQDLGRPGLAALGVSASGAADRRALREANRAVGNPETAAGLEHAGGGAVLRARGPAVAAVAGAEVNARIDGERGLRTVRAGEPFPLDDGDEVRIDRILAGLRVVIAVRGGIALPSVLGSLASDTLAGLGPRPLRAGDVVPLRGSAYATSAVDPHPAPVRNLPRPGEEAVLRVTLGPRDDWFSASAVRALEHQAWTATPHSDRVGIRLRGETPLERARDGELESEGSVIGAIQVPPDGQPVLFLPDHPLTGGYPVIGAVIDDDLDLAGQIPPGATVRFRIVLRG